MYPDTLRYIQIHMIHLITLIYTQLHSITPRYTHIHSVTLIYTQLHSNTLSFDIKSYLNNHYLSIDV